MGGGGRFRLRGRGGATALPPRQGGFTLLELIIALTVVALIAGVLGGVLRLGSRAWERGERQLLEQQRSRDLVALLSQEIRSAYPLQVRDAEKRLYFFEGTSTELRFVSSLSDPSLDAAAAHRLVGVSVEPGRGLVVESRPIRGGGLPERERGAARVLDSRVRALHVRYRNAEEWRTSWESKPVPAAAGLAGGQRPARPTGVGLAEPVPDIPRAVELTLTLGSSGTLGPLVVPIVAGTELRKANPARAGGS